MPLNQKTKNRLIAKRHRLNQVYDQIFEVKGKLYEIWVRWYEDKYDFDTFITQDRSPLHALYYEADVITSNPVIREFSDLKTLR